VDLRWEPQRGEGSTGLGKHVQYFVPGWILTKERKGEVM